MVIMDQKKIEEDVDKTIDAASSDVAKMPSRMTSVDDSVMLPEWYSPSDSDVICSWARQNHSHRKFHGTTRFLVQKQASSHRNVTIILCRSR